MATDTATIYEAPAALLEELPVKACYVGPEAATRLAAFLSDRGVQRVLLVLDENTRIAGAPVLVPALESKNITITEFAYPAEIFEATDTEANKVGEAAAGMDAVIGLGAGTLSDLAKQAGTLNKIPCVLFPTAASMNGYTSGIVALKVRGLKRTLTCTPALGVFADPEVVATAPQRMVAAGVADFLSKCSSNTDWQVSHHLRDVFFTDRPRKLVGDVQDRIFDNAGAIGAGNPAAIGIAMEALLTSGFGMIIAGSSAPASGGEHLISHFIDMKHALEGIPNDLHGLQVGVATIYTLGLWEKILALDPNTIDIDACIAAQPTEAQIKEWVFEDWGEKVGAEVWPQWLEKQLDTDGLRHEITLFKNRLPEIRTDLETDFRPPQKVSNCIAACGGPVTAEDLYAPAEVFHHAKGRARYLRNRFTVLDLAAELGLS